MIIPRKYLLAVGIYCYFGLSNAQGGVSHMMMQAEPLFSRALWLWSLPNAESAAIADAGVLQELSRLMPDKQRHYRKKNGNLYRFRYNYVDGHLVYSEEEVSDFIVNDVESHLSVNLGDGEYITLEQTEDNENEQDIINSHGRKKPFFVTPGDEKMFTVKNERNPERLYPFVTGWAKIKITPSNKMQFPTLIPPDKLREIKAAQFQQSASSLTRKSGRGGKRVSRNKKGRVSKPASPGKAEKKAVSLLCTEDFKEAVEAAEETEKTDVLSPFIVPAGSGMYQNPVLIPMYLELGDLVIKAEELGFEAALDADVMPDIKGLTENDWEGIAAFDDLVKGLLLGGDMTFLAFKKWLGQKKALRQKVGGMYRSEADAYVDLCLQYLALKFSKKSLMMDWDFFFNASGNNYIHVQEFFRDHPGSPWDFFCQERAFKVTKIIEDIRHASDQKITVIRELLREATKLEGNGFPEYLFRSRKSGQVD